jgi:hypothetical protein
MLIQGADFRFAKDYTLKYAAGSDEKCEVNLWQTSKSNVVHVVPEPLHNLKIKGARFLFEQDKKKRGADFPDVREIGYTELVWFQLGLDYTFNTCDFIRVACYDPANRAVILKMKVHGKKTDRTTEINALSCREEFEDPKRKFTQTQAVLVREVHTSPYATDKITSFNVRPPELSSIDSLPDYLRWTNATFYKFKDLETLPERLRDCPWIDGRGRQIRIFVEYLDDVKEFLTKRVTATASASYRIRENRLTAGVSEKKKT